MTGHSSSPDASPRGGEALLWAGVALWLVVLLLTWPMALSFGDEVAYLGQARLLLDGQIRPQLDSAGLWFPGPTGLMTKYPLFPALLLMPLLAIHPRTVFLFSVMATVGLIWFASRVLRSWGRAPGWALLLLAHPGIVILSRTAMADVPFAAAAVGAWWTLNRGRPVVAAALLAFLVMLKAPGVGLGSLLVAGCGAAWWRKGMLRNTEVMRRLIIAGICLVVGLVCAGALTLLTTGRPGLGYSGMHGAKPFSLDYLPTSGWTHLVSLVLCPPLLLGGALPYWKKRELGPLFVIAGFAVLMSTYFFVDWGPSWAESLVLSQRLILPVVAFLLIGYAELAASLLARLRFDARWALVILGVLALAVTGGISSRHLRWQRPMQKALAAASATAAAAGTDELALTYGAAKVGLLYPGPVRQFVPGTSQARVVLCGRDSASYRVPGLMGNCQFAGYRIDRSIDGFDILVRDGDHSTTPEPHGSR